jgi:hypothetical protein
MSELGNRMSQLIAKCRKDLGFKRKLLTDTAATLKAEGITLPAGLSVKVLENTDKVFHLVIPSEPARALSSEVMDKVRGGAAEPEMRVKTKSLSQQVRAL